MLSDTSHLIILLSFAICSFMQHFFSQGWSPFSFSKSQDQVTALTTINGLFEINSYDLLMKILRIKLLQHLFFLLLHLLDFFNVWDINLLFFFAFLAVLPFMFFWKLLIILIIKVHLIVGDPTRITKSKYIIAVQIILDPLNTTQLRIIDPTILIIVVPLFSLDSHFYLKLAFS